MRVLGMYGYETNYTQTIHYWKGNHTWIDGFNS